MKIEDELYDKGFHSINIPSEWGLYPLGSTATPSPPVSIQLISPASGDAIEVNPDLAALLKGCFHSINIPSEWGSS